MLPPTCIGMPDSRRMCPIRLVVVVLPFDPVTPIVFPRRNGAASSTSPITSAQLAQRLEIGGANIRAFAQKKLRRGHAGALHAHQQSLLAAEIHRSLSVVR